MGAWNFLYLLILLQHTTFSITFLIILFAFEFSLPSFFFFAVFSLAVVFATIIYMLSKSLE